jgi:choline dehydrogenase-like flavoprotein
VVVGSGATGGWAAKELTEAGYDVLVLDTGGMPTAVPRPKQPYELPLRNMFDNLALNGSRQPVQARSWACDEYRASLFIDDLDHPYEGADHFTWIRGSSVGGRMNVWGRQVYRYGEQDFSASQMDGHAEPWPFLYADLAPFYDEVESFIGVSGACDGLDRAPDGQFLPPMPMTEGEEHLKRAVERRWPERRIIIGRTATLTRHHQGRPACDGSGHCYRGCPTSSFFEPLGSTLASARSTGRLHLMPQAHVTRILMDDERGRARGVAYVDGRDGKERVVEARAVVLAASTIGSTRILMATTSPGLPAGLGSSSGVLGSYLHGHIHSVMCSGAVPWLLKSVGMHDEGRPNYIHLPQFVNNEGQEKQKDFVGGFGVEGAVKHYIFPRDLASRPGIGLRLKESIRSKPVPAHFFLTAFGVMLARPSNRVELSEVRDRWNIPAIKVTCSYGDNDLRMAEAMAETVVAMARQADFSIETVMASPGSPGLCVHEVGTARMGKTRYGFVLDAYNRVWDAPNVVVVDGACFPSSGPQNPTLTMMALSLRASRQLVRDLRQN